MNYRLPEISNLLFQMSQFINFCQYRFTLYLLAHRIRTFSIRG